MLVKSFHRAGASCATACHSRCLPLPGKTKQTSRALIQLLPSHFPILLFSPFLSQANQEWKHTDHDRTSPTSNGRQRRPRRNTNDLPKLPQTAYRVTVNIVHEDFEEEDTVTLDDNLEGYDEEFTVESDEDGYVTLTAPKLPFDDPAGLSRPNASACLWDAGLSTACHESRLAFAEHHNLKGWRELREKPINTTETNLWYHQAYPSTLVPHKRDNNWCLMTVPLFDIFCINISSIKKLPKSLYSMKLLTPFLSTRTFTIRESWNIAIKYDKSWHNKRVP
ncbi:hypothetical protein NXS19_002898 [Fusarium pseudograminearum]|nr:hypothetical protein NXS19_002898 [Fusarium pseudograminearum]